MGIWIHQFTFLSIIALGGDRWCRKQQIKRLLKSLPTSKILRPDSFILSMVPLPRLFPLPASLQVRSCSLRLPPSLLSRAHRARWAGHLAFFKSQDQSFAEKFSCRSHPLSLLLLGGGPPRSYQRTCPKRPAGPQGSRVPRAFQEPGRQRNPFPCRDSLSVRAERDRVAGRRQVPKATAVPRGG